MTSRLLAIKITGCAVAAAVYIDRDLHYIQCRKLSSDLRQAKDSVVGFVASLIEHLQVDSAVSEENNRDTRAKAFRDVMLSHLEERVVPHWTVKASEMFAAYGETPLKSVHDLRSVVGNYWPHIIDARDDKTCLDAAALGLYFQTERMLSDNSSLSP